MPRKPKTFDAVGCKDRFIAALSALKAQDNALASDLLYEFALEDDLDVLTDEEATAWWVRRINQAKREHKQVTEAWHGIVKSG